MTLEANWEAYSRNFDKITIEIGFGKSCTILKLANIDAYGLYVGVEILKNFCLYAQKKIQVSNVIIVNADMLIEINKIPFECIYQYFVFFPSPPINHRIFSYEFHEQILRTLKKNGIIKIVTDDYEYYSYIINIFDEKKWTHVPWTPLPFIDMSSELLIGTDCEIQYGAKYYLECYKK